MTDQPLPEEDTAVDQDAEQDQAAGAPAGDEQEVAVDAHLAEGEEDPPAADPAAGEE